MLFLLTPRHHLSGFDALPFPDNPQILHKHNCFQLWTGFFTLGVAYINQDVLQLEDDRVNSAMTMTKKQRILDRYGDMRIQMAYQIMSLWSHLGDLKHHFIPGNKL